MAGVEQRANRPTALTIVGLLFIIGGLMPVIQPIQTPVIGLGIINCLIGIGLWRRKPLARSCALISLCLAMAFTIFVASMMLLPATSPFVRVYHWQWQNAPKGVGIAFAMGLFFLLYWQYQLLRRADVRLFFARKAEQLGGPTASPSD